LGVGLGIHEPRLRHARPQGGAEMGQILAVASETGRDRDIIL
jgi:hypothetical protein